MSTAPRPVESVTREVRDAARRQADHVAGGGAWAVFASGVALLLMLVVIVLDYYFNQSPNRLIKVFAGAVGFGGILMWPKFGLLVFPIVTPFLLWIPPLPVPGMNATNLLLLSIFGTFALVRILNRQSLWRPARMTFWIALLFAIAGLSIFRGAAFPTGYSYNAGTAGLVLFRSVMMFASYFVVLTMTRGETERRRVAWAVLLGLLAESLVTIHFGRNGSGGRALGSFGQANELGGFLALFAAVPVALLPATRNWAAKLVLLGTTIVAGFGTVLSLSRGSMVALAVGITVVTLRSSRLMLVLFATTLLTSPLWAPDYLKDRVMESSQTVEGSDDVTMDGASVARVETWKGILHIVSEHPLDGVGWTGLGAVLPDVGEALGLEEAVDSAHNTYMRMLGELGVLGLLAFVLLIGQVWWLCENSLRVARTRFDRALAVGGCGVIASMAVSCAFGDRFFSTVLAGNMWVYMALVEDAWQENRGAPA